MNPHGAKASRETLELRILIPDRVVAEAGLDELGAADNAMLPLGYPHPALHNKTADGLTKRHASRTIPRNCKLRSDMARSQDARRTLRDLIALLLVAM
jgi:hypothetical protein